jgi:FemAB-related protein (PEP-CTERM system-associated)
MQETVMTLPKIDVRDYIGDGVARELPRLADYFAKHKSLPLSQHPAWSIILQRGLQQTPYLLEARQGEQTCGYLALAYVHSLLFGRFLVSLPYVNYGGVLADDAATSRLLIDHARALADQLRVRYLELRHVDEHPHPAFNQTRTDKVHMRLPLPDASQALWDQLAPKVRNQVRKGQKHELTPAWGGLELLPEFYAVFSRNMRDLGTPVFGRRLFRSIVEQFPEQAEFCLLRLGRTPVAAALLLHGEEITEVPSASALRRYNSTCANMLMYWLLLQRAIERGQKIFDFGRSTRESNTFRFKKQWGAEPLAAQWQYYVRAGDPASMRADNPRHQRLIRIWQRLPVSLTRWIGPAIVRGIP